MVVYGYKRTEVTEEGLLEMKEVTFVAGPNDLRSVAKFLLKMADEMESGAFGHTHRHMDCVVKGWAQRNPGVDIVVVPPDPDEDRKG